jgi:hypothetical protein
VLVLSQSPWVLFKFPKNLKTRGSLILKILNKREIEVINQNQRKAQHWRGLGFGEARVWGGNLVKKIVYYNPPLIQ